MDYRLESGVDCQTKRGRRPLYDYKNMPFKKMKKGQSFQVLTGKESTCRSCANSLKSYFKNNRMTGYHAGLRTVDGKKEVRVWRN